MKILEWIQFGKVAAERDENLSSYFYDNGALVAAISNPHAFLVLGRKGAGKTALFKHLNSNRTEFLSDDEILFSQSFEDYNWNIHAVLADETKAESMVYKQSWKFVIYAETVQAICKHYAEINRKAPKDIESASKILERLFDTPAPSALQLIGRKMLQLSKLKMPSAGLDLSSGQVGEVSADAGEISFENVKEDSNLRNRLTENVGNITEILERALKSDLSWPRTFICFDRVDEAWDSSSISSSMPVVAGLVAAADSINAEFNGKLRPLVFLREDIFETLSINDRNKLRSDCGALLHWNKNSLSAMILRRINFFAAREGADPVTSLDSIFDRSEMRQRQKPFTYILHRTMMRPRDLIAILTHITQSMTEKENDPFDENAPSFELLECQSVYDAEPGYSEWLKNELLDEWRVQKPIIDTLFQGLQNNGSTNITKQRFFDSVKLLEPSTEENTVIDHLKFLFNNSIIGLKVGNSTQWKYKCFNPSQAFVESDEYRVHDGLVRVLNLREPRS